MVIKISGLFFFAVLIAASIFMTLVEFMQVTYSEQESYITAETQYMKQSYTEEFPIDYEVSDTAIENLWWKSLSDCSLYIKNAGEEGGYFRIQFDLVTKNAYEIAKVVWVHLNAGERKEAMVRYDGDYVVDFNYSITPPVQVATKYMQVPYTREIVQSRDIEKTKNVTLLEYLMDW